LHDTIEHAIAADWVAGADRRAIRLCARVSQHRGGTAVVSSGRYARRACALSAGGLDVAAAERVMRDHYDGGEVHVHASEPPTPDDERYFSVCMHADTVGTTTASMVVELATSRRPAAGVDGADRILRGALPAGVRAEHLSGRVGRGWWRMRPPVARGIASRRCSRGGEGFHPAGRLVRGFWKEFEIGVTADVEAAVREFLADAGARERVSGELMEGTGRAPPAH